MNMNKKQLERIRSNDMWRFGGNRTKVFERDGYKCVQCGMTMEEHKNKYNRELSIDHIDGRGCTTPKEYKNNELNNLQTLCLSCHSKKDVKVDKLTKRAVWQLDLNGKRIKRFDSLISAERELNIDSSNITAVIRGRAKTTKGYKWEYDGASLLERRTP